MTTMTTETNTTIIPNFSFRWKTPDGDTTIIVLDSTPPEVQLFIGKAGSRVSAWAYALARMTNIALRYMSLDAVITELADISSDRSTFVNNVECRSTAEALSFALSEYKRVKRV